MAITMMMIIRYTQNSFHCPSPVWLTCWHVKKWNAMCIIYVEVCLTVVP